MKHCKIIVKDEVNVKIEGLELSERKALMKLFEFDVPGARYLPSVRLGRWNGKTSYFSLGGSSYINLLPEILPVLDRVGYDIELEDSRDYRTTFAFTEVTAETFKHKVWPKNHPLAGQPVILRDYQITIINNYLKNPQALQEIATGAGKTLITAVLSLAIEQYGRSIVIVPNVSLVGQTEADYINLGLDVGVYYGGRKEYNKTHTICTWQSLGNMLKNTKAGEAEVDIGDFLEGVVCVIVDEVHQAKAEVLKTLLTGVMSQIPLRWGLTGTIPKARFESMSLTVSLGPVIGSLSASTLQEQGVLSNCHVNILQLQDGVDFSNYQSELKFLIDDGQRLDVIADRIRNIKETGNTLVLVDRIEAGKTIHLKLEELGVPEEAVVFVSGGTKGSTRTEHYDDIATATNKIIIATYGVAAVGINIPRIFNVVLIEPGKSFVRVIQSIGRGIRKAEDKDFVQIYDMTSSCKFAKRHLTQRKTFYKEANYPFDVEKIKYK
ncbi:MAG: DEAD/DEAH box helicase family protein [Candidatus Nanopelagicus sp.]